MAIVQYAKGTKLQIKYFKKLFGRSPIVGDEFALPMMDDLYRFEFDRWADGLFSYNAFSKKNKPKHLKYITEKIIKHFQLN